MPGVPSLKLPWDVVVACRAKAKMANMWECAQDDDEVNDVIDGIPGAWAALAKARFGTLAIPGALVARCMVEMELAAGCPTADLVGQQCRSALFPLGDQESQLLGWFGNRPITRQSV